MEWTRHVCKMLIAEPRVHVTAGHLGTTIDLAGKAGWDLIEESRVRLSIAATVITSGPARA